ncbi:MAG: type II toxin-antitoxin system VapC family toxin [Micrococcales bacterium]|nr:type II toxin-antitoxin system VapC family toxin [Micrococcales bacterium]
MVTDFLLDTNVVSALRVPHRQDEVFRQWQRGVNLERCYISVLSRMELRTGILMKLRTDADQGKILDAWYQEVVKVFWPRTLPFGDREAEVCAPLRLLRTRGSIDTLIAATALVRGMTLVTRNVRDFEDIPALAVLNPWEAT